jgi:hypothetical protein
MKNKINKEVRHSTNASPTPTTADWQFTYILIIFLIFPFIASPTACEHFSSCELKHILPRQMATHVTTATNRVISGRTSWQSYLIEITSAHIKYPTAQVHRSPINT